MIFFYIFGVILGGVISITFFHLRPRFLVIGQAILNFSDYQSYWGAIKIGIIHIFRTFMFFKEEIMKNSNMSSEMSFDFSKYQKTQINLII